MSWSPVERRFYMPVAFAWEKATVTSASKALTAATYADATQAIVSCETADIRYRIDGGAPSGTDGHTLASGSKVTIIGAENIAAFRAFRAGGSDGSIQVTYLK